MPYLFLSLLHGIICGDSRLESSPILVGRSKEAYSCSNIDENEVHSTLFLLYMCMMYSI